MMKSELIEMVQNVDRGITFLDEHFPGWERKIDPDRLAMYDPASCILGHVGREIVKSVSEWHNQGYWKVLYSEFGDDWDADDTFSWSVSHGFNLEDEDENSEKWSTLGEFWLNEVRLRIESGKLSDRVNA